jgi:hypothetical protein
LNGEPGDDAEFPGVVPPFVNWSWQLWLGGPVPDGLPPPATATAGPLAANAAATPTTAMTLRNRSSLR